MLIWTGQIRLLLVLSKRCVVIHSRLVDCSQMKVYGGGRRRRHSVVDTLRRQRDRLHLKCVDLVVCGVSQLLRLMHNPFGVVLEVLDQEVEGWEHFAKNAD